jgi:hypothetical protein
MKRIDPAGRSDRSRVLRVATTTALLVYGVAILRAREFAAIDNVNLPIHEVGHIVFAPFPELLTAMGGSIFQVLFPAIFVAYFVRRRDHFAASVALWWVATNLWYVAIYIGDAQEQLLPLAGGGEHDWAFALAEMDVLQSDARIAAVVRAVGTLVFSVSIAWGYRAAMRDPAASASSSAISASPK